MSVICSWILFPLHCVVHTWHVPQVASSISPHFYCSEFHYFPAGSRVGCCVFARTDKAVMDTLRLSVLLHWWGFFSRRASFPRFSFVLWKGFQVAQALLELRMTLACESFSLHQPSARITGSAAVLELNPGPCACKANPLPTQFHPKPACWGPKTCGSNFPP